MLYTEFNIDEAKKVWQEEAREEAIEEMAVEMLIDGVSPDIVAKYAKMPTERVLVLLSKDAH
jgi:hypothetical protein